MRSEIFIITDLGFGDSGKGTITDYLAGEAEQSLVIRHSGGPQAAHNIITPDGRHHTFAQFGSGSFHPGSRTFLSRFMLVNPFNLDREAVHLQSLGVDDIWERLNIDARAPVITPWHQATNRIREISRGDGRHGSCGQGLGEVMMDIRDNPDVVLRLADLKAPGVLRDKLEAVRRHKRAQIELLLNGATMTDLLRQELRVFDDENLVSLCLEFYGDFVSVVNVVGDDFLAGELAKPQRVIFEGSQGALLDSWYGFHPHTTWSNTTPENALVMLCEAGSNGPITKLGVLRTYMTRHGDGPFVTEDAELATRLPEYHNETSQWAGGFRVGYLDMVGLRYGIAASKGIDALVVTHLDRLAEVDGWQIATAYRSADGNLISDLPVGPTADHSHQETLTALAFTSQPVYQTVDGSDIPSLLQSIEGELRLPIAYTSFGPTRDDKQRHQAKTAVFA